MLIVSDQTMTVIDENLIVAQMVNLLNISERGENDLENAGTVSYQHFLYTHYVCKSHLTQMGLNSHFFRIILLNLTDALSGKRYLTHVT